MRRSKKPSHADIGGTGQIATMTVAIAAAMGQSKADRDLAARAGTPVVPRLPPRHLWLTI